MRYYHKKLHISYKDHVTNEDVRAKIQQAVGPRHKLQWYEHASRSSGLAKTILQGRVKGAEDKADRKRGGKTTSRTGQAWTSPSPRGQWRTEKNGGNWLWSYPWCPNDLRGYGIGEEGEGEEVPPLYTHISTFHYNTECHKQHAKELKIHPHTSRKTPNLTLIICLVCIQTDRGSWMSFSNCPHKTNYCRSVFS